MESFQGNSPKRVSHYITLVIYKQVLNYFYTRRTKLFKEMKSWQKNIIGNFPGNLNRFFNVGYSFNLISISLFNICFNINTQLPKYFFPLVRLDWRFVQCDIYFNQCLIQWEIYRNNWKTECLFQFIAESVG